MVVTVSHTHLHFLKKFPSSVWCCTLSAVPSWCWYLNFFPPAKRRPWSSWSNSALLSSWSSGLCLTCPVVAGWSWPLYLCSWLVTPAMGGMRRQTDLQTAKLRRRLPKAVDAYLIMFCTSWSMLRCSERILPRCLKEGVIVSAYGWWRQVVYVEHWKSNGRLILS